MIKLNVKRKLGKSLIDVGIQEVENVEFARQLVEKGLAELIEGVIPEREPKKVEKVEPKKEEVKEVKQVKKAPTKKKKKG
jgi:hypothetical protein